MNIVDYYSRKLWIFILKNKNDALASFKQWKILIDNQSGRKVIRFRTYNGLEFYSEEFERFYKGEGIARHKTTAWTA